MSLNRAAPFLNTTDNIILDGTRPRSNSLRKLMSTQHSSAQSTQQKQQNFKRSMSVSDSIHVKLPTLHHSETVPTMQTPTTPQANPSESNWANKYEDFDIQQPIGYGSSAVVYESIYKPMKMRVAIKMIDLDMFERNQIDELRRETALMALCKHTNVLKVYGSFVNGSKLYIVTPYLSAGSCLDIMKSCFPDGFDEISIATILRQALEGLVYLHKNGHIHRDIKAGNLLMDEQGTVLLADFGVSSSLSDKSEVRKTFVGTPCWMAPEVMEQEPYDFKADIWSFGITALELANGHAPFAKYPPMKVLMMTLSNAPPTLDREHTKHKFSKSFKDMIDSCLQKDQTKRPSAEKLLTHPFFKQAKKKDYLIKSILQYVPPLDQRQHRKVKQKHISVEMSEEQWDFDDQTTNTTNSTDTASETTKQAPNTETSKPANNTVTIADQKSSTISDSPAPEQQRARVQFENCPKPVHVNRTLSSSSSSEHTDSPTKKHISFGDAVIKDPRPPPLMSPVVESPPPTPIEKKSSRFVVDPEQEVEVKKGRFSVNQTPVRGNTPVDETEIKSATMSRVASQDSIERKSRFEVKHNEQQSLSRDSSVNKISRFSIEKPENEQQPPQQQVTSPECRKKGRFELTGGSNTPSDHVDSQSPLTSPCNSISRGQRLLDPTVPHMMYNHLECLLKQNEIQKHLLQDLMMNGTRARSLSEGKRPPIPGDLYEKNLSNDINNTIEHLQQLLTVSTKENEKLLQENESLKKELDKLKKPSESS